MLHASLCIQLWPIGRARGRLHTKLNLIYMRGVAPPAPTRTKVDGLLSVPIDAGVAAPYPPASLVRF